MITIAGIIFSLVFICIMASIFFVVNNQGSGIQNDLLNTKENMVSAEFEAYNEKTVSGDTVISTINKFKQTNTGLKMSYGVCTGSVSSSGNWKYYGHLGIGFSSSAGASKWYSQAKATSDKYTLYNTTLKPGASGYISPTQEFKAHLVKSANDVVVGVVFVKA